MFDLRLGGLTDAAEIALLGKTAFQHFFENKNNRNELIDYLKVAFSEKNILKEFGSLNNAFLLAIQKEQIMGFARLWEEKNLHSPPNSLKMERLYIWPDMVGKGLGAYLMQSSLDYTKRQGFKILWLQVLRPNQRAVKFYHDWGFEIFHESPGKFKGDNEIDYWMKREV